MKFITTYSESHKKMMEVFLSFYIKNIQSELCFKKVPQLCSGNYMSENWTGAMKYKISFLIDHLKYSTEPIVYTDVDVLFLNGAEEYLKGHENNLTFQWDSSGICMGFAIIPPTNDNIWFFEEVRRGIDRYSNEQIAANKIIHTLPTQPAIFGREVYTIGMDYPMYSGQEINFPSDMKIFHANFTRSLADKYELINQFTNHELNRTL